MASYENVILNKKKGRKQCTLDVEEKETENSNK